MKTKFRKPSGGKSSSRFKYKPTDKKFINKHIQQRGRNFDAMFKVDVQTYKVRDGENKIRLVPRTSDEMEYWAMPIHVHYGIGPEDEQYLCPRKHEKGKCPPCEEYDRARKAGKEEEAKDLRPNMRFLTYLVDRKEEEKGIQVHSMPGVLDSELSKQTVDPESGATLDIDNPEAGYDVYYTKEGQGIKTKYSGVKLSRKETSLDNDAALEFAQKHPLPDILQFYPYEHILKKFEGDVESSEEDEDEDDEDEAPRGKKRRASRDEDEDDEDVPQEDEDDEDDEDEEEELKPRGKKKKRAPVRDEDEDEDESEDDEEEDDAPDLDMPALRKMKLVQLKELATEQKVDWKKLRMLAKSQGWDDTKLKIRLRKKIAEALEIETDEIPY